MRARWQEKPLGEILQLEYGKPLDESHRKPNGRFPVYGANGEKDRTDQFYHDKPSIIVGRKGSAGEINLTEKKFWPLDVTYFVTFDDSQHDLRFLYYLLMTLELTKLAKGVKPGINRNEVYSKVTHVPSLPEQQRIVSLLDEVFAGLATAKTNAEKNLQNARALFDSHLHSVFSKRGKGWVDAVLGDVCRLVRGPFGGSLKKSIFVPDGYAVYEQQHAIYDQFDDVRYFIDEEKFKEMKRFELLPDDLIMSCSGTMGRVAIVPKTIKRGIINQALLKLTPGSNILNAFLKSWMESQAFQDALKEYSGGAAIQNVASVKILKDIKVPIPSMSDQKRIVEELDDLREETQRLPALYERKLAALEALKTSLLHQAFSGKLTTRIAKGLVIPFPARIPNVTTTDLHAGILAIAYQLHEAQNKQHQFGHVKAEKVAHMIEAHLGIDLGRTPLKDAAGPNDYIHLKQVEHRAKKAGFFLFRETLGAGYRISKYRKFDSLLTNTRSALGKRLQDVEELLLLMLPMDTQQAEIFTTVYAAWNNLLIDHHPITDEAIVFEARENWHPKKLKIPRDKFFTALLWMREKGIVPNGKGKNVINKTKK